MQQDVDQLVGRFLEDIEQQETAWKARNAYRLDLLHFARWIDQTVVEHHGNTRNLPVRLRRDSSPPPRPARAQVPTS